MWAVFECEWSFAHTFRKETDLAQDSIGAFPFIARAGSNIETQTQNDAE